MRFIQLLDILPCRFADPVYFEATAGVIHGLADTQDTFGLRFVDFFALDLQLLQQVIPVFDAAACQLLHFHIVAVLPQRLFCPPKA